MCVCLTKGQHTSDQKIIFQFDYIILLNGVYFFLYVFSLVCQSSCSLISWEPPNSQDQDPILVFCVDDSEVS